jgi:nucleoside-diphosphate-sugar epimerase
MVTGAGGFVGGRLCKTAIDKGYSVRAIVRNAASIGGVSRAETVVRDISPSTDWATALKDVDVVIHLAARVHVMRESLQDPQSEYCRVNVEGTKRLALSAAKAGVRRIVYVSTIKVNGERTYEKGFSDDDMPSPQDPYSLSKLEAEEALHEISLQTGIETVILRPPLVYGPGVKGNMYSLIRNIERRVPLPLGGIRNKRSFISLDNLVDILLISATRSECAGQTFLVSDGEDLSTPELVKKIAKSLDIRPLIFNFPLLAMLIAARIVPSLGPVVERLTGSLVIDSTRFRQMLDWQPQQTVDAGIDEMVSYYLQHDAM